MRVLVMRPQPDGDALAVRLEALGYRVALAPVTAIAALQAEPPPGSFDAVLVTSAHALAALSEALRDRLEARPLYAVGRATAAAGRQAGFRDIRVADGDAAALRDLLRLTQRAPAQLLYLAGRVRKPELEAALAADGHRVTPLEVYDAVAAPWSAALCTDLRADPPDAALHFSRQSAARAVAASERHGLGTVFSSAWHVCLSPDVAEGLRGQPWRIVVAERPESDSLMQALAKTVAA